MNQASANVIRAVGAATAHASGCNWHRRAVKATTDPEIRTSMGPVADIHLVGTRIGVTKVQLQDGWLIGDLKAHLQGLVGASSRHLRLWRGQPMELPVEFVENCPPLEDSDSLDVHSIAPAVDAGEPGCLEADHRESETSQSFAAEGDEKELEGGPCFTLWVPPLDSALLMRRVKGLRRCITYQAWQAGDEQSVVRSQQEAEARAKAARDDAATKQAKSEARVAAWAQRVAQRPKFLRPGAAVEVRRALVLELRAPPSNGSGGVGVVPGRVRRITPADALIVVSKAPVPNTTNSSGGVLVTSTSVSSERAVSRDPNWCVVSTKDGWLGTIASGDLVPRRKPALSADEQYVANAGDARRKDAAAIAQDRQKWGQREWRQALVSPAAAHNGARPATTSSRAVAVPEAGGKENGGLISDANAEAWQWLLKRLEGRRLKAVDLFVGAPAPESDGAAARAMGREALWHALDRASVPLPADDFARIWQDLDPSGSGAVSLHDVETALREKRKLHLKMKPCTAPYVHRGDSASKNAPRYVNAVEGEESDPHVAVQREAYDQWLQKKR